MTKFKAGDKVRVIATAEELRDIKIYPSTNGSIISILSVDKFTNRLKYKCSDGFWYAESHLELRNK